MIRKILINQGLKTKLFIVALLLSFNFSYAETEKQNASAQKASLNKEYQAKALFLYNFANFVSWPDDAFSSDKEAIHMCLFGEIPFGTILDDVDGTMIGDRALKITRTNKIKDISRGCQILFVGDERRALLPEFWKQIKYIYVLSVGEQKGFTDNGGVINILRTTDKMKFDINISNAIANGLFISSDLLALAREIRRNTENK